jgi:CheY-like chemotaxis protein
MAPIVHQIAQRLQQLRVLIVDDEPDMRKVARSLLQVFGVTNIHEANDGMSGLEAICAVLPDIVILDWEMPSLNGADFVRAVRSPGKFPLPAVPIIMLTGHSERSRIVEAVEVGVHEYLLKPVSSAALLGRIVTILAKPRQMIRRGEYYGPEPRKLAAYKPEFDPGFGQIAFV